MNQLFTYDNGAGIPFYVGVAQGNLGARIQYGGVLTSALQARIHIVSQAGATMPPMDPLVPVLQARWVTDSVRERRMLPLYPYVDDPAQNNLKHLSPEDRDVAELLKAKVGNPGDDIFNQLHQRFPHNTTYLWRTLYQRYQVVIQMASARITPRNQEQLNTLILPLFPGSAIPAGQRPPKDVGAQDRDRAPRAPRENREESIEIKSDSSETDELDSDSRADSESVSQPPSTPRQASVGQQPVVLDFIDDFDEDGEEEGDGDEGDDTEYEESSRMSPSETPPPPRRSSQRVRDGPPAPARGVKFTQADYDAMVRFVNDLNGDPVTADWENFLKLSESHRVRSADAWRRKYHKEREGILAEIRRMRA